MCFAPDAPWDVALMEIGKPKRIHRVEPLRDPVPHEDQPREPAPVEPAREPEPVAPSR